MNTHVEQRLILFLDDELPNAERIQVERHLAECPGCSMKLEYLAKAWITREPATRLEPSPDLATRVLAGVKGYEARGELGTEIVARLRQGLRPAVALTLIGLAFLAGMYLGNVAPTGSGQVVTDPFPQGRAGGFYDDVYLDTLRDFPPGSIGGIYLALSASNPGRTR